MNKVDLSVGELVGMIARGELRLPEMQRRYVWRGPRVRDLIDSLYRGYPSGAILVWETEDESPVRDLQVSQSTTAFATKKLLLDGQQRLTSLSAVLRGEPVNVRGRKKPIDILFNLEHPEKLEEVIEVEGDDNAADDEDDLEEDADEETVQERLRRMTFVVANKAMASLPNWVSVSKVMGSSSDAEFLEQAGVTSFKDPRYEKYAARLRRLRDIRQYPYVMHLLDRHLSYVEVAEIFVRVNSLGVKLRSSDLAVAQITARWKNLLPLLEAFQDECEEAGFTIDQGMLVRSMVVFATGQCRFKSVGSMPTAELQSAWERAKKGLLFACNFLRTNGGIEDETILSSPFFLPAIAYLFDKCEGRISRSEEKLLLEWVLVGSGRGYFGGSSESRLDADLARLRRGEGAGGLVDNVKQMFGRLRFDEGDIAGKTVVSGLYGLVFLALKRRGAKDWKSGLGISLLHKGAQHLVQSHHIFPKAQLRDRYDRREINEIANMAFIDGGTNRGFGKKLPIDYLPGQVIPLRGEEALKSQCVPMDPELWKLDQYPMFLAARRKALVEAVNELLDETRSSGAPQ